MKSLYTQRVTQGQELPERRHASEAFDARSTHAIVLPEGTAPSAGDGDAGGLQRLATHRALQEDLTENGHAWTRNGTGRYRLTARVESPGSASLRAQVRYRLPAGATMTTVDAQGYAATLSVDSGEETTRWLPSVEGDRMGIEITLPQSAHYEGTVAVLEKVAQGIARTVEPRASAPAHGDRDGGLGARKARKREQCEHRDARCSTLPGAQSVRDSVARIRFEREDGTFACTAVLVNSETREAHAERPLPYMLTASHCISTEASAQSMEAVWFYAHTECGGRTVDPRTTRSRSGARLLATDVNDDWTLLELNESPPPGVVYAGWMANPHERIGEGEWGLAIHHGGLRTAQALEATIHKGIASYGPDQSVRTRNLSLHGKGRLGETQGGSSGSPFFLGERVIGLTAVNGFVNRECGHPAGPAMDEVYADVGHILQPPRVRHHAIVTLPGHGGAAQGFVRVHNNEDEAISIDVVAYDDAGERYTGTTVRLGAGRAGGFNTAHLEVGDERRPAAFPGIGDGKGFWRLHVATTHDIEFLGYARVAGGFVTTLHDRVANGAGEGEEPSYHVKFFNPGSNLSARSLLRLVNPRNEILPVTIEGLDARGSRERRRCASR